MKNVQQNNSRVSYWYSVLVILNLISTTYINSVSAQSIGYHPQFNFGFNPYFSPVFGYGLGLPFGANNISPTRYPWLLNSIPSAPLADKTGLMSFHSIKDKLNLMKHPENAYTPFGAGYGYGKHYGAAVVPNNPYKSAYSDYYDNQQAPTTSMIGPTTTLAGQPGKQAHIPIGGKLSDSSNVVMAGGAPSGVKPYSPYIKPLLKAGALITTAAILGKKMFEVPTKLNPSGMILNELRP